MEILMPYLCAIPLNIPVGCIFFSCFNSLSCRQEFPWAILCFQKQQLLKDPSNHIIIFIRSFQSLTHVQLFATPWITEHQASLSIANYWSLLKFKSIESVMPSNHLILCPPLLLLPSIFPSIRVFSDESALCYQVAKVLEFQLQHQSFQ